MTLLCKAPVPGPGGIYIWVLTCPQRLSWDVQRLPVVLDGHFYRQRRPLLGVDCVRPNVFWGQLRALTAPDRCNEVGFFQEGAPEGHPTLVTRLVQPPYDERQCVYMFEDQFKNLGHLPVPNVDATNEAYDGWFTNVSNLFFADAHRTSPRAIRVRGVC